MSYCHQTIQRATYTCDAPGCGRTASAEAVESKGYDFAIPPISKVTNESGDRWVEVRYFHPGSVPRVFHYCWEHRQLPPEDALPR